MDTVPAVDLDPVALDDAGDAAARDIMERIHRRQRAEVSPRGLGDGAPDRMLARVLDGPGEAEGLGRKTVLHEADAALGDGARLVEDDRRDLARPLQNLGAANEDAELGAAARSDHQRRRRGQPERARAGDDEHCDRRRERIRRVAGCEEPPGQRRDRDRHHDRDEDRGHAVREPLHGCFARLRLGDEARDLGEGRVGADPGRPDDEAPGNVDRRADDLVPGRRVLRHWLACQHRAVDGRLALDDDSVGGDPLARSHHELVADLDPTVGNGEVCERADGLAGAAAGTGLEKAAEKDERRDHAGDLEVRVRPLGEEERRGRPGPRGEGSEGDECVHGHRAVAEVPDCCPVERPARDEDDRSGERKGEPFPPVELKRRHHRDERQRHRQCGCEGQPCADRIPLLVLSHARGGGAIPGGLDRGEERVHVQARLVVADGGLLGREVDRCLHAFEIVQPALDAARTACAGHALEFERDLGHALIVYPLGVYDLAVDDVS